MKKVELEDVKPYAAAGHFNMTALRLHGKAETGCTKFWVGLSHFLPGGGAEFGSMPTQKVYYVLSGEVTIVDANNEKIVLKANDSIFIGADEKRSIINEANLPASMLVVMNYPEG